MRERESHENDSEVRLLFSKGPGGATRTWTRPPRSSKTTGGSPGRMRRRDRSGECTKLGLRPSNSPRHGTNVTMMSRAAHGRFEHVAASQHGRLREARGRKGKAGRVDVTFENARATRTTPHHPERKGEPRERHHTFQSAKGKRSVSSECNGQRVHCTARPPRATRLLRVLTVSQIRRVEASATPLPSHVLRSSSRVCVKRRNG